MNRVFLLLATASLVFWGLAPVQAESTQLSPDRLEVLDQHGYFTPDFKEAVHHLVDARESLEATNAQIAQLKHQLPELQKQAAEAEAKAVALRQELARYDHPEEIDFDALQDAMNQATAQPEDQRKMAQAYVWTYPTSPHAAQAQTYLQQVQQKIADQEQAEKSAEAARAAAYAKTVQRAHARDLSISEWRDFLRGKSQDEVVKLLGQPTSEQNDYWVYAGEWVANPTTKIKVGMGINFDAGRVLSVSEEPHAP